MTPLSSATPAPGTADPAQAAASAPVTGAAPQRAAVTGAEPLPNPVTGEAPQRAAGTGAAPHPTAVTGAEPLPNPVADAEPQQAAGTGAAPQPNPVTGGEQQPTHGADPIYVDAHWDVARDYRADPLNAAYLAGLSEARLLGARDPVSGAVIFPPRRLSEESFTPLTDLVELSRQGTIVTLTRFDSRGKEARPPRWIAFVQHDGADTAAAAVLRLPQTDPAPDPLSLIGTRVTAVFKAEPQGALGDYWYEPETVE